MKQRASIFIALFVVVATLGVPLSAHAVENEGIAMSPTSKQYTFDPGDTKKDKLTVINDGARPYEFIVYASPYSVEGEDYKPVFSLITPQTDAYSWVRFEKTTYKLEPNQRVDVPYTMQVPSSAESGGHYAVIFAETKPSTDSGGSSVVRKKRVGAIVYAQIKGNNQVAGAVKSTTIPFLQTSLPLAASSRIENTGNVEFFDRTEIKVYDVFNNQKFASVRDMAVLPGTTRNIRYQWEESTRFGIYKVTITHSFLGKSSSTTGYVLMIPLWLLLALLAIIIAFIAQNVMRKKPRKQAREKAKSSK